MKSLKLHIYIVIALLACSYTLQAQTYTISTVVGSGMNGHGGDGGPSADAELTSPCGIAIDSAGNIYIADDGINTDCIRKINTKGIITTIIGGRSDDFPLDDDDVIDELNYPTAIAIDKKGAIYIADKTNNRIRKLNTDGSVVTIAGNGKIGNSGNGDPATDATFKHPTGIAVDDSGNVYIADANNNCIRKVNSKGIISIFAGTGATGYSGDKGTATTATLNYPNSVCTDALGNVYIADEGNNCIRKVASGIITTIAGNGKQGFSGDEKLATDAELSRPACAAIDKAGNIYIADWGNNRVRKVDASGIISTIAGNGKPGYSGDGGTATNAELITPCIVCIDASGNIYVSDYGNHRIRKISAKGTISTIAGNGAQNYFGNNGPATAAELFYPSGVAVDKAGNIYSADKEVHRIHKTNNQGIISIIAGNGNKGYKGDGSPSEAAMISAPSGLFTDAQGNLYITDLGNHCIRKIDTKGIITTVAGNGQKGFSGDGGPATSATMDFPYDVTIDTKGNMYIADYANQRIRKINSKGIISTIAGNGERGYTGDGGPATKATLNFPAGIDVDAAGNIYVSDQNNNCIRKIGATGTISTIAGDGKSSYAGDGGSATQAELNAPIGIKVDADGNIYIVDSGNNCVRMINAQGIISTITGDGKAGHKGNGGDAKNAELNSPYGIAIDSAGNIYIADQNNNEIRKLTKKALK